MRAGLLVMNTSCCKRLEKMMQHTLFARIGDADQSPGWQRPALAISISLWTTPRRQRGHYTQALFIRGWFW